MDAAKYLEAILLDEPDAVLEATCFVRVLLEFWEGQQIQDIKDCIQILNAIVRRHEDDQV